MTGDPRWDPAALEDLEDGYRWYEEREPGLGRELAAEAFKALAQAVSHPFAPKRVIRTLDTNSPGNGGQRRLEATSCDRGANNRGLT